MENGFINVLTSRLYVYSRADVMIPWRDVQAHAAKARYPGGCAVVEEVMFERTPHCGHGIEEPEKYWASIMQFLDRTKTVKSKL